MEQELNRLATELFKTFSRFEYSLKASGFHKGDGNAEPNWRAFAESVTEMFENPNPSQFADAVNYILTHPPKKPIIAKGLLEWNVSEPQTDLKADLVLLYVRRVRNNLFHGGKFNGHWFAPERSEALLSNSLIILSRCLEESVPVRDAYEN